MNLLNGIQLSILEFSLIGAVFGLTILCFVCLRRLAALDAKLSKVQVNTAREIKMVNQGAIGIGRRFALIEKNLKQSKNVASFDAAKESRRANDSFKAVVQSIHAEQSVPTERPVKTEPMRAKQSTRAEQALTTWINEHQSA